MNARPRPERLPLQDLSAATRPRVLIREGPTMTFNLRNRSFLKVIGFTPCELRYVLRLAGALKLAKYGGSEVKQRPR